MKESIKQSILEYIQTIPQGKVSSYKNIWILFDVHPRTVAMVMKHNKHPETYPCYKVISHSGKISGYNTEKGIPEKIEKLIADGIPIQNGKIVPEYII